MNSVRGTCIRFKNVRSFQQDPEVRFIVSNQTVGGYGQTWTAATYVIYYSNSFSYEDRYQSEDRAHRKGQHNHVTYQDIEMAVPEDKMILRAIRKKKEVEEALS
jgi:SNF2 family DNA or RNA helicase